jgi:hypothetical protein
VLGLVVKRQGWKRGFALLAAYTPVSGNKSKTERKHFYADLRHVEVECKGANNFLIVWQHD